MSSLPSAASGDFDTAPSDAATFLEGLVTVSVLAFVMSANTGRVGEGGEIADGAMHRRGGKDL